MDNEADIVVLMNSKSRHNLTAEAIQVNKEL